MRRARAEGQRPAPISRRYGRWKEKKWGQYPTEFFSVTCWDTKEAAKVSKGARLEICGRLHDSTWTDQSGVRHYATDIVADSIVIEDEDKARPPANIHGVETSDHDVPF